MIAFRDRRAQRTRPRSHRPRQPGRPRARHRAGHARLGSPHRRDEDAGAAPGARTIRLRCGLRRRAARRGEVARQGAGFFLAQRPAPLGPEAPAAGALAALQHAQAAGREHSRVPALELDRARHLALHPRTRTSRSCRSTSPPSARSCGATASSSWSTTTALPLKPGETVETALVRFRTLGCYPLTGAVESTRPPLPRDHRARRWRRAPPSARAGSSTRTARPRWSARSRKAISDDHPRPRPRPSASTRCSPRASREGRSCASSPAARSTTASRR